MAPLAPTPPALAAPDAAAVARYYYDAIAAHDYRRAYAIWHGKRSLELFRRGYADARTVRVRILPPISGDAGMGHSFAEVKVRVDAVLRNGRSRHFAGSYRLSRVNDIDGATPAQRRWHIDSAELVPVAG